MFGDESSPVGGTVGVDPESHVVDGDMMMKPTNSDQVVGVVVAAVGTLSDVVGLEAVAACASFDRALPLIPIQDVAADRGRDRLSQIGIGDGVESAAEDDAGLALTQDL